MEALPATLTASDGKLSVALIVDDGTIQEMIKGLFGPWPNRRDVGSYKLVNVCYCTEVDYKVQALYSQGLGCIGEWKTGRPF